MLADKQLLQLSQNPHAALTPSSELYIRKLSTHVWQASVINGRCEPRAKPSAPSSVSQPTQRRRSCGRRRTSTVCTSHSTCWYIGRPSSHPVCEASASSSTKGLKASPQRRAPESGSKPLLACVSGHALHCSGTYTWNELRSSSKACSLSVPKSAVQSCPRNHTRCLACAPRSTKLARTLACANPAPNTASREKHLPWKLHARPVTAPLFARHALLTPLEHTRCDSGCFSWRRIRLSSDSSPATG